MLGPAMVRLLLASLRRLIELEARPPTGAEFRALNALRGAVTKGGPRVRLTVTAAMLGPVSPALLPIGAQVVFRTAGRTGRSPPRPGIVVAYRRNTRGLWIIVAEDGAAPGVNLRTRPGMVQLTAPSG